MQERDSPDRQQVGSFEVRFVVTLVEIKTNHIKSGTYKDGARFACVERAFLDLVGKPKAECLDTWKVLDATEIEDASNS